MVTRIGPKKLKPRVIYLAAWREHAGLSQKQLADRLSTSEATISRYENLKRDPTLGFLEAAAEALNTTASAIVGWPPSAVEAAPAPARPKNAEEALEQLAAFIRKSA